MVAVINCFLLCILTSSLHYSAATVDGVPRWKWTGDKEHVFHSTPEDSSGSTHGRNSPFVQFYIDLGFIIIIMILLYLLWKVLAAIYPQLKMCASRNKTERSISMTQLIEMPPDGRDGTNESQSSYSPPDDSEVIIGFENPLHESCLQAPNDDRIVTRDKPPEYESVVLSDRNSPNLPSVVRRNHPESPPPKYFKYSPLFEDLQEPKTDVQF